MSRKNKRAALRVIESRSERRLNKWAKRADSRLSSAAEPAGQASRQAVLRPGS